MVMMMMVMLLQREGKRARARGEAPAQAGSDTCAVCVVCAVCAACAACVAVRFACVSSDILEVAVRFECLQQRASSVPPDGVVLELELLPLPRRQDRRQNDRAVRSQTRWRQEDAKQSKLDFESETWNARREERRRRELEGGACTMREVHGLDVRGLLREREHQVCERKHVLHRSFQF
eukprot:2365361-Rhodomonas_salina.2